MEIKNRRKQISKYTGLTGVQAGHILKAFDKQALDIQSVDWKTLGGDASDFGDRYNTVIKKLGSMYGISLKPRVSNLSNTMHRYNNMQQEEIMGSLMQWFERRSHQSKMVDLRKNAKHRYKPSNKRGVKKWKKHPNRYDIVGIDDIIR